MLIGRSLPRRPDRLAVEKIGFANTARPALEEIDEKREGRHEDRNPEERENLKRCHRRPPSVRLASQCSR